jgi:hypothetical protein
MITSTTTFTPTVAPSSKSIVSSGMLDHIAKPLASGGMYVAGNYATKKVLKEPVAGLLTTETGIEFGKQAASSLASDYSNDAVMQYLPNSIHNIVGGFTVPLLTAAYKEGIDLIAKKDASWKDRAVDALLSFGADTLAMNVLGK